MKAPRSLSRSAWGARVVFLATGLGVAALIGWWFVFLNRQVEELFRLEMLNVETEANRVLLFLKAHTDDPAERLKELSDYKSLRVIQADAQLTPPPYRVFPLDPAHPALALIIDGEMPVTLRSEIHRKQRMLLSEGMALALLVLLGVVALYRNWADERRLNTSMDFFISAVNHELKTPLTSVRLILETTLKDPTILKNPTQLFTLGLKDVDRLQRMVDVILLSNRLAQGPAPTPTADLDLAALMEEYRPRAEALMTHAGGQIQFEIRPPLWMKGEPEMIERVLDNLLENSIKYAQGAPNVTVKLGTVGSRLAIEFSDRGIGLTREERKRLFDRFYQGARVERKRGVGLGMFVTKMIVESYGGSIKVESEGPGKGAQFHIEFPALSPPNEV